MNLINRERLTVQFDGKMKVQ